MGHERKSKTSPRVIRCLKTTTEKISRSSASDSQENMVKSDTRVSVQTTRETPKKQGLRAQKLRHNPVMTKKEHQGLT